MKLALSHFKLVLVTIVIVFVAIPALAASKCSECPDQSASAEGCEVTDIACLCPTFPKFQQDTQNCLQTNCADARELQLGQMMVQVVQIGCRDLATSNSRSKTSPPSTSPSLSIPPAATGPSNHSTATSSSITSSTSATSSSSTSEDTTAYSQKTSETMVTSAPYAYSSDATSPSLSSAPISTTHSAAPYPTISASTTQRRLSSGLTIGSVVGIALGTGTITICLSVLVSSLYIKRYKRRTLAKAGEHAGLIVSEPGGPRESYLSIETRSSDTYCEERRVVDRMTFVEPEERSSISRSLDVQASSTNLSALQDSPENTAFPRRETVNPIVEPKTSWTLRRFVNRIVPVSAGKDAGEADGRVSETTTVSACADREERRSRIRCEGDGGKRAAELEGSAGEVVAPVDLDQYSASEELPPPYSSHI